MSWGWVKVVRPPHQRQGGEQSRRAESTVAMLVCSPQWLLNKAWPVQAPVMNSHEPAEAEERAAVRMKGGKRLANEQAQPAQSELAK
ncbi:hypothetical protein HaLaN_33219, partial [Haematococcus lacustris]